MRQGRSWCQEVVLIMTTSRAMGALSEEWRAGRCLEKALQEM